MRNQLKFVALSDTHGKLPKLEEVPKGDIFVFCGDFTSNSETHILLGKNKVLEPSPSMKNFFRFVSKLPHTLKLIICGNHDFIDCFSKEYIQKEFFKDDVIYLQNTSCEIDILKHFPGKVCNKVSKLKVFGSPFTSVYLAFHTDDLEEKWKHIEDDVNVLITHIPPRGVCDLFKGEEKNRKKKKKNKKKNEKRYHWGCESLLKRVEELPNLKVHFFGHVHHRRGKIVRNGVTFVNSAVIPIEYFLEI